MPLAFTKQSITNETAIQLHQLANMSWFEIRPNSGLSLPLETAILWCGGGPECPICHIVHPAEER
jgi:hypothetical protein